MASRAAGTIRPTLQCFSQFELGREGWSTTCSISLAKTVHTVPDEAVVAVWAAPDPVPFRFFKSCGLLFTQQLATSMPDLEKGVLPP